VTKLEASSTLYQKIKMLAGVDVEKINSLSARLHDMSELDAQRVVTIGELSSQLNYTSERDEHRIAQISDLSAKVDAMVALDQQRVDQINDLVERLNATAALDGQRVAKIDDLIEKLDATAALDCQRVAKIDDLVARLNSQPLDDRRSLLIEDLAKQITELSARFYTSDGISVTGRNLSFLDEPDFARAWAVSKAANAEGWPTGVPDVRWRAHVVLWAARRGMALDGDFVECGVHTGLFSLIILELLNLEKVGKVFHLFDTFNGIPTEGLTRAELKHADVANANIYRDVWAIAQRNFAPYRAARLIKGALPGSLDQTSIGKIAFLSMDLNNATAESETIARLWDRIVPGAAIVLDDFAWEGAEDQHAMWTRFAATKGCEILTLPTGQGVLIAP
jgi:O-methyltransferase